MLQTERIWRATLSGDESLPAIPRLIELLSKAFERDRIIEWRGTAPGCIRGPPGRAKSMDMKYRG